MFSKHVPLEVDFRMGDFLCKLQFERIVRKFLIDGQNEVKGSRFVRLGPKGGVEDAIQVQPTFLVLSLEYLPSTSSISTSRAHFLP
jgi:hypothetical protein